MNAWEQRKLGEVSEKVKEKNSDNLYSSVLTNSAEFGIIPQRDFFDKDIANEKSLNGYYIVKQDDFVYNPRISNHAPVGPIKRNRLNEVGVMSPLYYVFRTHNIENSYLATYFDATYWHKFMKLNGDSGARADRFAIKDSLFIEMPIPFPPLPEQTAIGSFFKELDQLITLQQRELELMKEGKKTLLSKMFPKDGENFPEIRFPSFTNAWEQRKLGAYLTVSKNRNVDGEYDKSDVLSVSGDYGIVNQIKFQGRSFAGASVLPYGIVETGDVVYTKSPLKANPYGIIKTNHGKNGIVSTLYAVYKVNNVSNGIFVEYYFDDNLRLNKYLKPLVNKGAKNDMKVTDENVLKGDVIFPSFPEQTAIGSFFQELDQLITLQQRELEILKTMKSTLLKAMFA